MSNSIIPNFLPPAYDFTTEEDYVEEEDDSEEEEEEEDWVKSFASNVFDGAILGLVLYGLIILEVSVELKLSVNGIKKQAVISLK